MFALGLALTSYFISGIWHTQLSKVLASSHYQRNSKQHKLTYITYNIMSRHATFRCLTYFAALALDESDELYS